MGTRRDQISEINALAELERIGWDIVPVGDHELKVKCPVPSHADGDPSATFNTTKNVWTCKACGGRGDIVTFIAYATGVGRRAVLEDLGDRYDLSVVREIDQSKVEGYHSKIWEAGPLLHELRVRGVTDGMIRKARLGYDDGRITIPIYKSGRVVNVRRYLPGAETHDKMKNTRGFGQAALYRGDDLENHDKVVVCGGELKALVVGEILAEDGVVAVSPTAGEGNWDAAWSKLFTGKRVWIMMDVDAAGVTAARKYGNILTPYAASVRIAKLPLDRDVHPKGDVNDYVGVEGAGRRELLSVLSLAEEHQHTQQVVDTAPTERREVALKDVRTASNIGSLLEMEATILGVDTSPYAIPSKVEVRCDRDQRNCGGCPINYQEPEDSGYAERNIPSTSPALLAMVNASDDVEARVFREAFGIPPCRAVTFRVLDNYAVHDVMLGPMMSLHGEIGANVQQPAILVDEEPEPNLPCRFTGCAHAHPRTNKIVLVVNESEPTRDSLASFTPSDEELDELRAFTPNAWTADGIEKHLDRLYSDLEHNVTGIYNRRDMHMAVDLAYHSPLFIPVRERAVNGWLNVLVLGDSAQGKSETCARMMEHYDLGQRIDAKSLTTAGLLGGVQQLTMGWYVSWGAIPRNDRGLVILEELKGASVETISAITDMRSTGQAELTKIVHDRTFARTRMIAVSNPRGHRTMADYVYGIEAVSELIGAPEDVRRFDLVVVSSADDLAEGQMSTDAEVPHEFTAELCRRLVLWAWTLGQDRIRVPRETVEATEEVAKKLAREYASDIPLVDAGTTRHKILRLATALAARTFSVDERGSLVVRTGHVGVVERFMKRVYSHANFAYDGYASVHRASRTLESPDAVKRFFSTLRHARELVQGMLQTDKISREDVEDWCGVDRDTARQTVSMLVRHRALQRSGRATYAKTPPFIEMLRRLDLSKLGSEKEDDLLEEM